MVLTTLLISLAATASQSASEQASEKSVALEAYGRLPSLEDVAISPDGSKLAYVHTDNDTRILAVTSLATREVIHGLRLGDTKLRGIAWADDDRLLLTISKTDVPVGLLGEPSEWFMLDVYDIKKNSQTSVPRLGDFGHSTDRTMNVIWGQIVTRRIDGHTVLFVPGVYVSQSMLPALFRIDLDNGIERIIRKGDRWTDRWLVDEGGAIAAEQSYFDKDQRWSIRAAQGGRLREVASGSAAIEHPELLGFGPQPNALLVSLIEQGDPVWRLLSLDDGKLGPPLAERRALESPILDRRTQRMIGGVHIADDARYVFFEPTMQQRWDSILQAYAGEHVRFVSASDDFKRIVVRVEGMKDGFRYVLVDLTTRHAALIGDVYSGISGPLETRRITYTAGDGLDIPAYLTLPRGREPKALPLVVLVHGGPAARDTAEFDWWSQAFADQGYAVLRPNFRGSSLNWRFLSAGFGEWGRKMQSDLSDGVRDLVKRDIVDAARVCIVGGSYGGYAALAGVTLDPGVYRCAISVAGPADLKRFLEWQQEKTAYGRRVALRYWDRFMGVTGPDDPLIVSISPIKHLDALTVPVLLIHGRDDTVVPYEQSSVMYEAMRKAGKHVDMITLKKEDHWLSRSETRLQMLKSSVAFLRATNPP